MDGDGDAAKIYGLKRDTPSKAYRQEDLELWWPLDGNYSDMSGNGRNATATVNESNPWQEGRLGQAFTFTGNDHLEASNPVYRGITGTQPERFRCGSRLRIRIGEPWHIGDTSQTDSWWFRLYRNQLLMNFRNAVRRSYVKNLIDGLWHHVAVVNPDGGNHRDLIRLYTDGQEVDAYGQWGNPQDINTGSNYTFRIGKRWNNGQRYVGAIDDVRLYSADFSEFEIQRLVREASGLPVDLGEDSYTVSVWAKPTKVAPVMDYKFAIGWYEGGGGEYIQAKLAPGTVDEPDYNDMFVINPTEAQQATIFPYGLSERLFDGSFNDQKLNDTTGNPNVYDAGMDGRGFRFNTNIPTNNSIITINADANFSVLTTFSQVAHSDSYVLWEHGGTDTGAFAGYNDGYLRIRAGDGNPDVSGGALSPSTSSMALVDIPHSQLEALGYTDGNLYELRWEIRVGDGFSHPGSQSLD